MNKIVPPTTGVTTFKQHYFFLKEAGDAFNIPITLDLTTTLAKLSYGQDQAGVLYPQFIKSDANGIPFYQGVFDGISDRFAGWRPYSPTAIESLNDKIAFKKRLQDAGCLVPQASQDTSAVMKDIIVKRKKSAFSLGIKGPFLSSCDHSLNLAEGEFYEQFITGEIAKIWYCNQKPICMELAKMPEVIGDGRQNIRELIFSLLQSKGYETPADTLLKQVLFDVTGSLSKDPKYQKSIATLKNIEQVLTYYGKDLSTVLALGQQQCIEFRYFHGFLRNNHVHWLDRCERNMESYLQQLSTIGLAVYDMIQQSGCGLLFYTVDAIVDNESRCWVLEANSNPMMHPFVYEDMVQVLKQHS